MIGPTFAHYEILEKIGSGGMGDVYRARDTKLERDVAIKVLPAKFASDPERLARFEREAKLLASLNHPNIASIHGFEENDGVNALVLELVEGPTLAERIEQGPILVDEAIAIAKQMTEALEAGHEAGVIHRDLKPANVKLKENGAVKVLDYGLAKALEDETPSAPSELSQSPTLTRQGTQAGVILGTAAYMSPEQAKGKRVDRRTDVWAFGAVLYEMLTGQRAFGGEDVSDTLAAVLRAEPDWDALPAETSESLRLLLRLCLNKDLPQRMQSIGDARLALEGAFDAAALRSTATLPPAGWRPSRALAGALALSIATGFAVWRMARPVPRPRPVVRFSLPFADGESLTGMMGVAISSDGRRLVYNADGQIYLRTMDQTEASPVRGTERARYPFFSPDGEWIGFTSSDRDQLKKVAIRGGTPVALAQVSTMYSALGARWGADDTIVYGQAGSGIMQMSADGGKPEVLIPLQTPQTGCCPQFLPGEKAVLFTLGRGINWDDAQIAVHSIDTGETKILIEGGRDARYVPTGHLAYVSRGTLFAAPFDVAALEIHGATVPVAERVWTGGSQSGVAHFSFSSTGALAYVSARESGSRTLVWVDRGGREELLPVEPRPYEYLRISPDGGRVVVSGTFEERDIWVWDFARETMTRLTSAFAMDTFPVWTPDGTHVVFASDRDGAMQLYRKAADGTGVAERLIESENRQYPYAFTPDGTQLVFLDVSPQGLDLAVLRDEDSPEPLLATGFAERNGELSPDGEWLAFESDASGQFEIYVRPFPNVEDGQWLISSGGGRQPLWAPNGRELFYMAPGERIMALNVRTEEGFEPGNAEELFVGRFSGGPFARTYDISPDGKRFLMIQEGGRDEISPAEIILVLNWYDELRRLVPLDR